MIHALSHTNHRIVCAALITIVGHAQATTPPPSTNIEDVLCRSELVLIGKATNFRLVRVAEQADLCPAFDPAATALDHCTSVQVTVIPSEVLYPNLPTTSTSIEFRFGGGLFSVPKLRNDLLGGDKLFHLVRIETGPPELYATAYPWRLGAAASFAPEARSILARCKRQ
jgi:hypothetical protein